MADRVSDGRTQPGSDREIIARYLDRFTDQPYRQADVLIGHLDKAGLIIVDRAVDNDVWLKLETERDLLRTVAEAAEIVPLHVGAGTIGDHPDRVEQLRQSLRVASGGGT